MSSSNNETKDEEVISLDLDELEALEDEILNDTAGGTDGPISPNYGCSV